MQCLKKLEISTWNGLGTWGEEGKGVGVGVYWRSYREFDSVSKFSFNLFRENFFPATKN